MKNSNLNNSGGQNRNLKFPSLKNYWWVVVSSIVFGLDRYIKTMLMAGIWGEVKVNSWLGIKMVFNDGLAFGMGSGWGLIISVIGLIIFLYFAVRYHYLWMTGWLSNLAVGLVLGGAISNVYDRLVNDGRVVDYISVVFYSNFNLADVAIVAGLLILVGKLWKEG